MVALYEILGYPDGRTPDPISWEKFATTHGHLRRVVGWEFNTRDLTFALPADKRNARTELLSTWLSKTSCTILEAAELHGSLSDASRANRKGRAMFFGFQNAMRRAIQNRYHQVKGFYHRQSKLQYLSTQLPKDLHHRLDSLIARDIASLIWKTKTKIEITAPIQFEIGQLHSLLADANRPWSISIGYVIPRDPQFTIFGDACPIGGGAFSHKLEYWFDLVWSDRTRQLFDIGHVHINVLEFIIVLLQLAAAITRKRESFKIEQKIQSSHSTNYLSDPTTHRPATGHTSVSKIRKRAFVCQHLC